MFLNFLQCSGFGSGPVSFWASRIQSWIPVSRKFGSGSFHHQAKMVKKTFISTVCDFLWLFIFEEWGKSIFKSNSKENLYFYCLRLLYDFLSLKNNVNRPLKSNKQKTGKFFVVVGVLKVTDEKSRIRRRIGSVSQRNKSVDPDPYQNVTDPEHWFTENCRFLSWRKRWGFHS